MENNFGLTSATPLNFPKTPFFGEIMTVAPSLVNPASLFKGNLESGFSGCKTAIKLSNVLSSWVAYSFHFKKIFT